MRNYHDHLQIKALSDLTNRAKSGIFIYLANWLVLSWTFDLPQQHPDLFYLNTAIFVVIMLSRLSHFMVVKKQRSTDTQSLTFWLVFSVLAVAIHWGFLAAWFIYQPGFDDMRIATIILTPCFALGAACTLSISSEIRNWFPALCIVPSIVMFLFIGGQANYLYAGLTSFLLIYIAASSKASHNDYWSAITNHMVAEERAELMEKLSTTDPLTQLKNRMFFDNEFAQEWKRCNRVGCPLSAIMIDLDHFKTINDTYGHLFGDECLRAVARTLASEARRPSDCIARYGGEEFVMLLPNTNERGMQIIAQRILEAVARIELKTENGPVRLTCSIGGATTIPDLNARASDLLQNADTALYTAKQEGRNRYIAFQA